MNYKLALSNGIPLLNALVDSRLTYGCQTWALTAQQKERLSSTYISMLRKMIRGGYKRKMDTWRFVYSNEQLLELCHVESIGGFVHRMQRSYLAHIIRKRLQNPSQKGCCSAANEVEDRGDTYREWTQYFREKTVRWRNSWKRRLTRSTKHK